MRELNLEISIGNKRVGNIVLELDEKSTPVTAGKIGELAGIGFYDEVKFHRVIKGFMIQGGDPLTKNGPEYLWGTGGPDEKFDDENFILSNTVGTISMANSGRNTNGSQFFINTKDNTFLDGKHVVFGKVKDQESVKIIKMIEDTETDYNDRPLEFVVIKKATVNQS